MTLSEINELVNYIDDHATKYSTELPDGENQYATAVVVKFNELMHLLADYCNERAAEKEKETCGPNYEDMYNRCVDSLDKQRNENGRLRANIDILTSEVARQDKKLEVYSAALNAVEVMTGNTFGFMHQGGTE